MFGEIIRFAAIPTDEIRDRQVSGVGVTLLVVSLYLKIRLV